MPKETKANRAIHDQRLTKIFDMLIGAANRAEIWQYVTTSDKAKPLFEGVSRRQLDRYIQEANVMIEALSNFRRENEFGKAKARYERVFATAMKVQDTKTAIAAQARLDTLMALTLPPAAQTLKIEGLDTALLQTLIAALQAKNIKPSDAFNAMLAQLSEETTDGQH